jgi:uncharacterized protein
MSGAPLVLIAAVAVIAALYASVGHAGASGYLAAMALLGVAPASMRPTALVLNVVVACIGTWTFARAGHFDRRLFVPLAAASVPCAYLGGRLTLPDRSYELLVGAVLLVAAVRLLLTARRDVELRAPPWPLLAACGAGIGLLSGLTGVGGGILLSPVLLLARWADARRTAAVSVAFILVNSIAGLAGRLGSLHELLPATPLLALAAAAGGALGARWGARGLGTLQIRRLLALVVASAALKMLLD